MVHALKNWIFSANTQLCISHSRIWEGECTPTHLVEGVAKRLRLAFLFGIVRRIFLVPRPRHLQKKTLISSPIIAGKYDRYSKSNMAVALRVSHSCFVQRNELAPGRFEISRIAFLIRHAKRLSIISRDGICTTIRR